MVVAIEAACFSARSGSMPDLDDTANHAQSLQSSVLLAGWALSLRYKERDSLFREPEQSSILSIRPPNAILLHPSTPPTRPEIRVQPGYLVYRELLGLRPHFWSLPARFWTWFPESFPCLIWPGSRPMIRLQEVAAVA